MREAKINDEIQDIQDRDKRKDIMLKVLEMMEDTNPVTKERVQKFFGFSEKDTDRLMYLLKHRN